MSKLSLAGAALTGSAIGVVSGLIFMDGLTLAKLAILMLALGVMFNKIGHNKEHIEDAQ